LRETMILKFRTDFGSLVNEYADFNDLAIQIQKMRSSAMQEQVGSSVSRSNRLAGKIEALDSVIMLLRATKVVVEN
jgi:hypothetical protein